MKAVEAVLQAHQKSAYRSNGSTTALRIGFGGSGDYLKALTCALSTLGGAHGPVTKSAKLLSSEDAVEQARLMLARGEKVPGWGASFPLPDPDWAEAETLIRDEAPELAEKIDAITALIGKPLPNPSTWTAAAAIIEGIPPELSPYLFVLGRLGSWTDILGRDLCASS